MKKTATIMLALAGLAVPASAEAIFTWDWNRGDPGGGVSDNAGTWESITATYGNMSDIVSFDITFSDQVTNALTLAMNHGENPKGHNREMALLYIADGTGQDEGLTASAYVYNGQNNASSYRDSNGAESGNQTPGMLESSEADDEFLLSLSKTDTPDGKRTFSFTMDASAINGFSPSGDASEWTGLSWGQNIGWWIHSWENGNRSGADYNDSGELDDWNFQRQGYFDGAGGTTTITIVPLPTAGGMAMLGLAGVAGIRRRA